jgi:hypothetical protein
MQPNKITVYNAGDYFFESGEISHSAYNKTSKPVVVLNFEIVPVDCTGSSAMASPK